MAAGGVFVFATPPILCKLRKLIIIRIPPNECNKSSKSVAVGLLAVSVFRELGSPALCNVAHGLFYPQELASS